jgi:hypothetical protein
MALSADGSFAAFSSNASNLISGSGTAGSADTNGFRDVFLRRELFSPSGLSAPRISGSAVRGQALSGSRGAWAGTPEIVFAQQWQRCDGLGANCVNITGANGMEYMAGVDDVGRTLRFRVRAANAAGTVWRTSTATKPVAAG